MTDRDDTPANREYYRARSVIMEQHRLQRVAMERKHSSDLIELARRHEPCSTAAHAYVEGYNKGLGEIDR